MARGRGIDLAALTAPEHAEMMENLKEQMLIVFLHRLGGKVDVPVAEVDEVPAGFDLAFSLDMEARVFHFELRRTPDEPEVR